MNSKSWDACAIFGKDAFSIGWQSSVWPSRVNAVDERFGAVSKVTTHDFPNRFAQRSYDDLRRAATRPIVLWEFPSPYAAITYNDFAARGSSKNARIRP